MLGSLLRPLYHNPVKGHPSHLISSLERINIKTTLLTVIGFKDLIADKASYVVTDTDPLKWWLHKIGRAQDAECVCGERTQNAAHILQCKEVGDRKGRTLEEAEKDEEWCEAVFDLLIKNRRNERGGYGNLAIAEEVTGGGFSRKWGYLVMYVDGGLERPRGWII